MPDTQIRPTGAGDADAIAAHRPRDADAFARQEPSRPAPMHAGAVLVPGTRPDMPVTLPAAGSLADRITRVAAIMRQRKTPARATSATLPGPLFRLLASTGLLRWPSTTSGWSTASPPTCAGRRSRSPSPDPHCVR